MTLKIISATEVLFEGDVDTVTLPGEKGRFTVLNNHASLISTLVAGDIVYGHDSEKSVTRIEGGIADVDSNIVSVCVY
ncbi:MAG: hypothetical protein K2L55_04370 [Muribaculaceae bacterium]|nr:hypothetical protein [Muribaculaceae bacterium]MDE6345884.1 hypothetical protein [Muribaculaceae bacterium]